MNGQRFQLRNPQGELRTPWFLIPWIAFPMVGALLVWFTRDDLERSAFYWVFFGTFQVFWTWAALRMNDRDPETNFAVIEDERLSVRLGAWEGTFAFEALESVHVADKGVGTLKFWLNLAREPRGQHVVVRLRSRKWFLPFRGGWPTFTLPLDVVEQDDFVEALQRRLRG